MADRTVDTFVVGTRVRLDVPTIHKTGIVAAYDGRYQDDLVPVKWDGEDGILFPERGLLRRLSDHECDGLPCYDAQCPNSPLGRRTQATYRDKYAEAAGVLEEVLRSQLNETVELDRTFAVEIMEMLRRA